MVDIQALTVNDQEWVIQLARRTQVYCPDCVSENLAFAAKREGNPLGYIVWQIVLDEASLLGIAVQPFMRRQKIATALYQHSEKLLIEKEIKTVFLEVRQSNLVAQKFYQKLSYTQVGVRKNYYEALPSSAYNISAKEHAIVMRKFL